MDVRFFENGRSELRQELEVALRGRAEALGAPLRLDGAPFEGGPDTVTVFFANHPWATLAVDAQMAACLAAGGHVLPILDHPDHCRDRLPEPLKAINVLFTRAGWEARAVDAILMRLWLHRPERRIFISYKRTDSAPLARQLWERLSYEGFDVFLDDVSINRGDNFQEELRWRLNDVDLVLLLASPNLGDSRWVAEELAFAENNSIGMLAVEWPETSYRKGRPPILSALTPDQRFRLAARNRAGGRLPLVKLEKLVTRVIEQRVVAVQHRLLNVMVAARRTLGRREGTRITHGARLGDLVVSRGGEQELVRVLPFRPDAEQVYHVDRSADPGFRAVGCVYVENNTRDQRAQALRWVAMGERGGRRQQIWALRGRGGA